MGMYEMNEKNRRIDGEKKRGERFEQVLLEEVDSTNDYAKAKRGEGKPLIVRAKRQSGGRGTKGRSFASDEGGVYLSKLSFCNLPTNRAFEIMIGAAVAVCETVAFYGVRPQIKWPNDILVNGKKMCGILIENTFSGGEIASSVVGIGLNVNNVLSEGLLEIATTLRMETGKSLCVEEVAERLISALDKPWRIEDYRRYLGFMGECVTLIIGDERIPATLLCVSDEGKLIVETESGRREFSSAEVSVRV